MASGSRDLEELQIYLNLDKPGRREVVRRRNDYADFQRRTERSRTWITSTCATSTWR